MPLMGQDLGASGGAGPVPSMNWGLLSSSFSPKHLSLCPSLSWGRKVDAEAVPKGSRGCAWAAAGHASRAAPGPWQGSLAAALLPAVIYNLSLNGNSPGCSPDSPVPAGDRVTQPTRAPGSDPTSPAFRANPEASALEKSGAEGQPRMETAPRHTETDATLLVTLGECNTKELGSVRGWFVHNSDGKQQQQTSAGQGEGKTCRELEGHKRP